MYNNYLSSSVVMVLASTVCMLVLIDTALANDDCEKLETDLKGCLANRWETYNLDKIAQLVANGGDTSIYGKLMVCSALETNCAHKKLAKKCKDVKVESKQALDAKLDIAAKSGFTANEANCKKLKPKAPTHDCKSYLPCLK
ncbi:uncharacterized protein LOC128957061 [Oppia nitens]|uniref:uncharacterized protein LOC128957061 n=1 Tax=Oppia nitens TaxID=1686743 RepID=UPI0023DC39C9|nr:uncharacterized protein LOC128957061 [Oppia nitens]